MKLKDRPITPLMDNLSENIRRGYFNEDLEVMEKLNVIDFSEMYRKKDRLFFPITADSEFIKDSICELIDASKEFSYSLIKLDGRYGTSFYTQEELFSDLKEFIENQHRTSVSLGRPDLSKIAKETSDKKFDPYLHFNLGFYNTLTFGNGRPLELEDKEKLLEVHLSGQQSYESIKNGFFSQEELSFIEKLQNNK